MMYQINQEADTMLNVRYAGFGGNMEVPCYEDEKGKLYFDENNGVGVLNLYTGAYRDEFGDILGEPDKKVTEVVRCVEPFARHINENDYRMLGRLKSDCEYFLGYGAGNEDALYYKNVAAHCDAMEKLWNSFSEADKPEWLSMEDINEYRHIMTKALMEKNSNYSGTIDEPLVNISDFEYDEDGYLHFSVEADGWELEGLYRIYDPDNGDSMTLISIDYGFLHPIIQRQWDRIEKALYNETIDRFDEFKEKYEQRKLKDKIPASENVTESVTLQHSKGIMSAAIEKTDEMIAIYKNEGSKNVTESVTFDEEEQKEILPR